MKQTLCVIDMQPYFQSSHAIVENVVEQIVRFRRMECPIILVEYGSYGRSHDQIFKALDGYNKNMVLATKPADDGAREVIAAALLAEIPLDNVVVCGVNICYCVAATAGSLALTVNSKIIPAPEALNCSCGRDENGQCIKYMNERIETKLGNKQSNPEVRPEYVYPNG